MLQRLIAMTALMLVLGGHIEEKSLSQTAPDSYSAAMNLWEKSQKARVSDEAKSQIISGFREFGGELSDLEGNKPWRDGTRTLNQTLVIYYLDDLRDAKSNLGFLGDSSFAAIGVRDVEKHPVKEFVSKIKPVLKGKKGELHTVSTPPGAHIVLDNVRKIGFTEKITVEKAGNHPIQVFDKGSLVNCSDNVTVPDAGTVTFHCP